MPTKTEEDFVSVRDVRHEFTRGGGRLEVLRGVSMSIARGEFVAVVGPSGCGKSTLMRIVAGLQKPTSGCVLVDGREYDRPSPKVVPLFQDLLLFEWMSVADNVGFPLQAQGVSREEAADRVRLALGRVGLSEFRDYFPGQLSGGMKQRLALARLFVSEPLVVLLDEPFSSLDGPTKRRLESEVANIAIDRGWTSIMVTHDVRQGLQLADRIVVVSGRPGEVVQTVEVPEARPRPDSWRYSQEAASLEAKIEGILLASTEGQLT